jgi:hypothetical protein
LIRVPEDGRPLKLLQPEYNSEYLLIALDAHRTDETAITFSPLEALSQGKRRKLTASVTRRLIFH